MQVEQVGRLLIGLGIGLAVLGGLLLLLGRTPIMQQFGNLPGDIRFQSADGRFSCFAPIVSMILLSVILTVVLNVVLRLVNR